MKPAILFSLILFLIFPIVGGQTETIAAKESLTSVIADYPNPIERTKSKKQRKRPVKSKQWKRPKEDKPVKKRAFYLFLASLITLVASFAVAAFFAAVTTGQNVTAIAFGIMAGAGVAACVMMVIGGIMGLIYKRRNPDTLNQPTGIFAILSALVLLGGSMIMVMASDPFLGLILLLVLSQFVLFALVVGIILMLRKRERKEKEEKADDR